jgi:hypothetical protein
VSDHDPIAPIEDALQKLRPAALEPSLMARLSAARPRKETLPQKSAWRELLLRWLLPVATMDARLRAASALRRALEQAVKAARLLASPMSADNGQATP